MPPSKMILEIDVDGEGHATAVLKGFADEGQRATDKINQAGKAGTSLKDVFTGNLLADFFRRGADAAVDFGVKSIQAAALAEDANRRLEFSATQAGLSYVRAAELAESFGKRIGASNKEAAQTLADIIELAKRAGRSGDIDQIQGRFADLAAARGLRGAELQTLIGTILSGADEGLNRLGIKDPGKLKADFAATLGTTADKLNEAQIARAALTAVLEKGAEAEGESEKRLRGVAGQLDSASAAAENLTTQFGQAITQSVEFRDGIVSLNTVLGSLVTSHEEARRQLAKGLTPEQIARAEQESALGQAADLLKGLTTAGATFTGVPVLLQRDLLRPSSVRQEQFRTEQLGELQREQLQQQADALNAGLLNLLKAGQPAPVDVKAETNLRIDTLTANLNASVADLQKAKADLARTTGLKAEDTLKFTKQLDEAIKRQTELAKTARDSVRDFLGDVAQRVDKDNPFVKLFTQMETASARAQERFGVFGKDFAERMAEIERSELRAEIAVARFSSQLQALRYQQEAQSLRDPFVGLTGPEERRRDTIGARIADITEGGRFRQQADFLANPFAAPDGRRQLAETLSRLLAISTGGAGRAGRELQSDAILQLASQFDSRTLATSGDPVLRQLRDAAIGANRFKAGTFDANVRDAIERARAGNQLQTNARERLATIGVRDIAAASNEQLKLLLNATGELSDKELTGDLRLARARALDEASRRELSKAGEAERRALKLEGVLTKLDALLTAQGLKVDAPPSNINITAGDGLQLDQVLGNAARPETSFNDEQATNLRRGVQL